MTPAGEQVPRTPHAVTTAPNDRNVLLRQLEASLAEQILLARSGNLDKLTDQLGRTEEILTRAQNGGLLQVSGPAVDRIAALQDELRLILEAQKSELAHRLKKIPLGKNLLSAYRPALARP